MTLGTGFLTGKDAANYTVASPYQFNGAKITKQNQAALTITGAADKTYKDAAFTVTVAGGSGTGAYDLTSSDPAILKLTATGTAGQWTAEILKAGKVTLTANRAGDENYEAATAVTKDVTIRTKAIAESDFTFDLADKTYTGSEIRPAVTSSLLADADYTVTYSDNVNVGQATITVTGTGNCTGTVTKHFNIVPRSISGVTISGLDASYPYTGSAITPAVTVTDGTMTLVKDTDYTIAYSNNTALGTATITLTGKGNYKDTKTTTFAVVAGAASGTVTISGTGSGENGAYRIGDTLTASIAEGATVDQLTYQWYNKNGAIAGATSTTYTLKEGDTSVYVVVTSSGNYAGSLQSETVEVGKSPLPGTVTASIEDKDGNGKNSMGDIITVTVSGGPSAEHYSIVWMRDSSVISGASGTTYTIVKADQGKTISVKIVAKGDSYTGEKTADKVFAVAAVKPDAPVLSASAGNQKVTLTWAAPYDGGSAITGYTLTVTPANGTATTYTLAANVTSHDVTGLTNGTAYTFTLIASNEVGNSEAGTATATPKAPAGENGSGSGSVSLTFETGGGKPMDKISGEIGTVIDLTKYVPVREGYVFVGWYADKALTKKITSIKLEKDTVVYAKWEKAPAEGIPFLDVKGDDWFYSAVLYVYEKGIMNGVSTTEFSPKSNTSRAMIVTMLYRLENEPEVKTKDSFSDVAAGQWYSAPIAWASSNHIVNGIGENRFAPNNPVTREQLAAILYRYAQYKNADVSASADLSAFADAGSVSDYAVSAMQWAVGAGIINGRDGKMLAPTGTATRAEVATMIMRFAENVL